MNHLTARARTIPLHGVGGERPGAKKLSKVSECTLKKRNANYSKLMGSEENAYMFYLGTVDKAAHGCYVCSVFLLKKMYKTIILKQ